MHRFFLPPEATRGSTFTLADSEAHHAIDVLRLRSGERVSVLNGVGDEFLCEIEQVEKRIVRLRPVHKQAIPPLPYKLTLVQAIAKGKAMEFIVQKAAELGVHRIVPIQSERTVAQVDADHVGSKIEKWEGTAVEAIKQCGSAWLPKIDAPKTVAGFLSAGERFDITLIATLQPGARHPRVQIDSYRTERGRLPGTVAVWVGPEGDFTPAEVHAVLSAGALPITLGQLILRSETAAIYCLSVLNYELQAPGAEDSR